jgi:hypothetical protein
MHVSYAATAYSHEIWHACPSGMSVPAIFFHRNYSIFLNDITERELLLTKEKPKYVQRNIKYWHANFHNCRCCGYSEKCFSI